MNSSGVIILSLALLGCTTWLTSIKILPTEACGAIFGSFATALVMMIQKNAYQEAIKNSMRPPEEDRKTMN